jgi:hypothetical protein
MICFPEGLVGPAEQAGIKVPDDLESFDANAFPHWHVYCSAQLGSPMPSPDSHWRNATLVGAIPEEAIRTITPADLLARGWQG